jgi:hypothetical protein
MRAASYLAFAVISLSTVAAPSTAPNATSSTASWTSADQNRAIVDAALSVAAAPPARQHTWQENLPKAWINRGMSVGETLPEAIALHFIPKHETYRYAVLNDHRVIVDAASRKVVYVIR